MTNVENSQPLHRADLPVQTSPYHVEGMPEGLQLTELDQAAGLYQELENLSDYQKEDDSGPDIDRIEAKVEEYIRAYLEQDGLSSDGQTDEERQEYELAFSAVDRAIRTSKEAWMGHTANDGSHSAVSLEVFDQLLDYYQPVIHGRHRLDTPQAEADNDPIDGADSASDSDTDSEDVGSDADPRGELNDAVFAEAYFENARFDVGKSREVWATLSAKRQGRAFSMKKEKAHREEIRDAYHQDVQKLGIMELADQFSDDDSDAEKSRKVLEYLFEEQKKLRELTTEKLQGTKVGRFVNFMNKGSRKARFMKAVGLGLTVGLGGSLVLGAAGAAGAAVVAAGASRFVRGYVRGDRHRGMADAEMEEFDESHFEPTDTLEDFLKEGIDEYHIGFEEATKAEQAKRRKALAAGAITVALGAGIGFAVSHVGVLGDAKDAIHDKIFGGDNGHAPNNGPGNEPDGDSEPKSWAEKDADGDGVLNGQDLAPYDSGIAFDVSDIPYDARWVEPGEGWYRTFQDLGIPRDHWNDVLQDAGPKLQDQGWAYRMPDGQWGISHSGRLSNESLRIIAKAAKRDGFTLAA